MNYGPNFGYGTPVQPYGVPNYNNTPMQPYGVPNYNNTSAQPQNYNFQSQPIIFDLVQGDEAARNYPMSPNTKAILMDMNNCLMWSKVADAFGKIDVHKFKFEELPFGTQLQEDAAKVTADDLKQVNERLTRIEEMLKEHHNG